MSLQYHPKSPLVFPGALRWGACGTVFFLYSAPHYRKKADFSIQHEEIFCAAQRRQVAPQAASSDASISLKAPPEPVILHYFLFTFPVRS